MKRTLAARVDRRRWICVSLGLVLAQAASVCAEPPQSNGSPRLKYGLRATRLFEARKYVQSHEAPDFWALLPYYVSQRDDRSCSVAAVTMLVNAARADRKLQADDRLATQIEVLEKAGSEVWRKGVAPGGAGMTLAQLGEVIAAVLPAYDIREAKLEVVHLEGASKQPELELRRVLVENEKSANDFLIINFLQSEFTGDPAGAVGHMALVAAFDADEDRVLILDPDRQWYEPYWVSVATLLKGLATQDDDSGRSRGYIHVQLKPAK